MCTSREEIAELNLRDLGDARFKTTVSVSALAAATMLHYEDLIAEALIARMFVAVLSGEVTKADALAGQIRPLMARHHAAINPLFYWTWCECNAIARTHRLEFSEAEQWYGWAAEAATNVGFGRGVHSSLAGLGRVYSRQGKLAKAIEVLAQAVQDSEVSDHIRSVTQGQLAEMFEHQGHLDQALEHRNAALDPDLRLHSRQRCEASIGRADLLIKMCRMDEAKSAVVDAQRSNTRYSSPATRGKLILLNARLLLHDDQTTEAELLALESIHQFRVLSHVHDEMLARGVLATIYMQADRVHEAVEVMDDERVSSMGPWYGSWVARLRADAHRHQGDWEQVVVQQDEIQRYELLLRRDLTELYSLLKRYQEGKALRRQRELLARTNAALGTAQQEKDDLVNIVAHDLQSPLTSLDLTLELLARDADDASTDARVNTAESTIDRIQAMVDQLSTLNELERGALEFSFENVPLDEVIQRVLLEFDLVAKSKSISLSYETARRVGAGYFVRADRTKLEQILANLVSNAIKYSPADTAIDVDLQVTDGAGLVPADQHNSMQATITVSDEGLGLSSLDLTDLFGKFVRASSRPTGGEASSGIGLYIARSIAKAMGGDITAESQGKGRGSSFAFSMPVSRLHEPPTTKS